MYRHAPKPRIFRGLKIIRLALSSWCALLAVCHGLTPYDFGNPTGEEQQYIELINRARANPPAEGARLAATTDSSVRTAYSAVGGYGVNLTLMQTEFNAIAAQPPLAPNAALSTTARSHSAWMLANATQSHNETSPANDPFERMIAAGYNYTSAGENIYATASSVWYGHAGFEVDWGSGTGGMQGPPRGHRESIHNPNFREIGVGVVIGVNEIAANKVGPQLVTQDFAAQIANPALGTGVAYYDLNSNGFYDLGEGIAGLTVNVDGSGVTQYCTTAIGGGWVVPIPTTASTRAVTFSGLNINQSVSLVVPASKNAKADLKLTYSPPAITSPTTAKVGETYHLTFAAVGGATGYTWNCGTPVPAAAENCESTSNITAVTSGTYAVRNTVVFKQGTSSFHLENSTGTNQSIELNSLYYGQASPSLTFQSQVGYATASEQFKMQVKEEGSLVWQDAYGQVGTGEAGEAAFTLRSVNLSAVSGKCFRIRFVLNSTGSYFAGYSGSAFGWLIDAITFTGVSTLNNFTSQQLDATGGSFTPNYGTYLLAVMPVVSNRDFPASYQLLSATIKSDADVELGSLAATYNGSPKAATATTTPAGLTVTFTYNGSASAPTAAGSYTVVGTINDTNYQGSASGTLVISKASASVTLGSLAATYNGSPKAATATTVPAGMTVTFTYDGSATAPTVVGSYAVVCTASSANYQGSASGTLVISKASASVTLGSLAATYNGSPKAATATTVPAGMTVTFTYDGSPTPPAAAGSYAVVCTASSANYQGDASGTLVISKATASVTLGSLAATYNGSPKSATATTTPAGMAVTFTYNGSATDPTAAASYAVVGTINDLNYQGSASGTLVISKASASVTLGSLAATYIGSPKAATATTTPAGMAVTFTYNGSATAPTAAGSYAIVGTINDTNYQGSASGTLVISKASASVTLGSLAATYNGSPKAATATTVPTGMTVTFTYDGSATAPTVVGSYAVVCTASSANYQGSASGTLVISKASASVTLGSLAATYNGSPKAATATTVPAGMTVTFTYDGSPTPPAAPGSYAVVGTISNANYQGSASGTLVIYITPTIVSQPVSPTIAKSTTTTLRVIASGNALTYQWYRGNSGTTTTPVSGATAASYTTPSLTVVASYKYWVRVSNPAGYVNSVNVTIKVVAGAVTRSFATWASEIELANSLAAGSISGDQADYDHDGRSNLLEYAFGSSPIIGNDPAPRMPVILTDPTQQVMQYQRDTSLTDLTFTAQACSDLGTWKAPGAAGAPVGFTDVLIATSGTIQTRQAKIPRTSGDHIFMRIQVSRP